MKKKEAQKRVELESHQNLLEALVERTPPVQKLEGVMIGTFVGQGEGGVPLVDFQGNPMRKPIPVRTALALGREIRGRQVALLFEGGDPRRPILLGPVQNTVESGGKPDSQLEAEIDGERVVLSAEKEIVLRCGKSSITLTRAGKILIRGAYLSSRSSGVNRIKGGSVQIN